MHIILSSDPFAHRSANWISAGAWPASWIAPVDLEVPEVWECRCSFTVEEAETLRVHISADERYELWLDEVKLGRGPERGDPAHWYYNTYDLELAAGTHALRAQVWSLGQYGPRSQMSVVPGFLCSPDPDNEAWLDRVATGRAKWEVRLLPGWSFEKPFPHDMFSIGYNTVWRPESAAESGWTEPKVLHTGAVAGERNRHGDVHLLRPALLPLRDEKPFRGGTVRHCEFYPVDVRESEWVVESANHIADEEGLWSRLLAGETVTIPKNTCRRVILDLEDYVCAYPRLSIKGDHGASVDLLWAESLFLDTKYRAKGNRNEIEGKYFYGVGDRVELLKRGEFHFAPPFWRAGRYLELLIDTAEKPLELKLDILSTGYPIETAGVADAGKEWAGLLEMCERTVARSCHDAFTDGPFYEQMMWAGDCLQNALTLFVMTPDARPVVKALDLFAGSRAPEGHHGGLPAARWPARDRAQIAPYSLYWLALLHEYAFWRNDLELVRRLLPAARAVLFGYETFMTNDGLVGPPPGWNFIDWVPSWNSGIPPKADREPSAVLNWQLVWAYRLAERLEATCGEAELATLWRRKGAQLAAHSSQAFWDGQRGVFADDMARESYSEHAQTFAILSGHLGPVELDVLKRALSSEPAEGTPELARATVSFAHHLFEAYRVLGSGADLVNRMEPWFELPKLGLFTTPEAPEPARSDCHAWSAHPLYHLHASIAGIRPAAAGFASIQITPLVTELERVHVVTPHPQGQVEFTMERRDGALVGRAVVPAGVPCTIHLPGETLQVMDGKAEFRVVGG